MLRTCSLYGLLVELSLADVRLSLPPKIDEIPQLELFAAAPEKSSTDCKLGLGTVSYEGKCLV